MKRLIVLMALALPGLVWGYGDWSVDENPQKWNDQAKQTIDSILNMKNNMNMAKNVILFLGDGMGIPTITAGRIRKGQLKGHSGEEEVTNMERFPRVALSKTYNINAQTPDSAGTATAYLTGVKSRLGVLGVDGRAAYSDCKSSLNTKLDSIIKWARKANKSTGIVTTTRITHATPGAAYSNCPDRNWESYDGYYFKKEIADQGCKDIAAQLIEENSFINVIFAGGRVKFLRKTDKDYENSNKTGDRVDGRNLINEWEDKMTKAGVSHKFVWNLTDFESLKKSQYNHVLGLLAHDHLSYELDRKDQSPKKEPSLAEITEKAIELLSANPNGFFLLVEGGRIDLAHHEARAILALADFIAFDEAVGKGMEKTSEADTLLVVTADHSHTMSIGGYGDRGIPILGVVKTQEEGIELSTYNVTHTVLKYADGPGGLLDIRKTNLTNNITEGRYYQQEATVHLAYESHGGEDVAIFAKGPMSHLFEGTVEQNYIAHAMAYASCIGAYQTKECEKGRTSNTDFNSSSSLKFASGSYLLVLFVAIQALLARI